MPAGPLDDVRRSTWRGALLAHVQRDHRMQWLRPLDELDDWHRAQHDPFETHVHHRDETRTPSGSWR